MAINKKVSDSLGLFDEIFGKGFGEENDWCLRAEKRGFRNVIAPNLFVYHKHGTSFTNEDKKNLQKRNLEKLTKRYPNYNEAVQEFIQKDDLKPLRDILSIIIDSKTKGKKKLVLNVDHNLGGGSYVVSSELCKNLGKTHLVIHLKFDVKNRETIFSYFGFVKKEFTFRNIDPHLLLEKIFSFFDIDYVIINQLVTWNLFKIFEIIKRSRLKYLVYLHDYFFICPNWNLIDFKGKFCGIPDMSECQKCLDSSTTRYNDFKFFYPTENFRIDEWRKRNFEFLKGADELIAPSESCKQLFLKSYPQLKIKTMGHFIPLERLNSHRNRNFNLRENLTIGIIGAIGHLKGLEIIKETINHQEFKKLNVKIVLIGYTNENISSPSKDKFFIHGKYENKDLPKLLDKYKVDLVFIPSITPETFSFSAAEAQILGYPVMCFDIGAPAERIKKYESGIILKKMNSNEVILKVKEILSNPEVLIEFSKNTKKEKIFTIDDHLNHMQSKL
jgi:glycosyltransferase involved in cell wall biosynthesis